MKILRLRAYYFPEATAGIHLDEDLIEGMAGSDITCVNYTPIPTRGVSKNVTEKYKRKKIEIFFDRKNIVKRFAMFREGKNPLQRAFRYFCCNIVEYYLGSREKEIDLVYSSSTPPTQGMLSALVAKKLSKKYKKKVPFVYNLQDIFPDSLVNTGMTHKGSFLWKIGRKIENYTYENADKIIVISKGFKRNIMAKGVPEEKIEVISNWIDLDSVHPVSCKDNKLISEFGIDPDKFLVIYAGNFGAAQGADVALKVAEKLKNNKDIKFVIFGGGAYFEEAKKAAEKLDNVFIHELMPADRISEVYSLGDVALITCKPGTGNAGMPSKTWSIMACNTPIIASFDTDSDLADVIRDSGAGVCVEPGDVEALTKEIRELYSNWKSEIKESLNLREYVRLNASKDACVARYIETIRAIANKQPKLGY